MCILVNIGIIMDPIHALSLFKPVQKTGAVETIGVGGARRTHGGQPLSGAGVTFGTNGTGEVISDYGAGGASALAYKGLSNDPNQTVGAKFDTKRLGIYGY